MNYIAIDTNSFRYISHHGIKGQKWGIRRFQNEDGTLTKAGKDRAHKSQGYSWLQDKLGYDERDEALRTGSFAASGKRDLTSWRSEYDKKARDAKTAANKAEKSDSDRHKTVSSAFALGKHIYEDHPELRDNPYVMEQYRQAMTAAQDSYNTYLIDLENANKKAKEADEAKNNYETWQLIYQVRKSDYDKALSAYKKTPLGMIDSALTTISNGKNKAKQLISKLKVKIGKGPKVEPRQRTRR